jgi:hypothetical protein
MPLFADMDLGGWICGGMIMLAVYSFITLVKSAGEAVSTAASAAFQADPETTTRAGLGVLGWLFGGDDS